MPTSSRKSSLHATQLYVNNHLYKLLCISAAVVCAGDFWRGFVGFGCAFNGSANMRASGFAIESLQNQPPLCPFDCLNPFLLRTHTHTHSKMPCSLSLSLFSFARVKEEGATLFPGASRSLTLSLSLSLSLALSLSFSLSSSPRLKGLVSPPGH